jgi:hypothetical protein
VTLLRVPCHHLHVHDLQHGRRGVGIFPQQLQSQAKYRQWRAYVVRHLVTQYDSSGAAVGKKQQ